MKLPGWCESCKKVKPVRVSGAGMARVAAGQVAIGTCGSCEARDDERRHA